VKPVYVWVSFFVGVAAALLTLSWVARRWLRHAD
jgi:hypothetical protein